MDVHIPNWREVLELITRFPVILVILLGQLFGAGFTQLVKKTYLAWTSEPVSDARYKISVRWLSVLSTYFFTVLLWHGMLAHQGAEEIICAGLGFISPLVYDGTRAMIAWKWPQFAAKWGEPK